METLITTLTLQKPIVRVSDIFTVGTRLYASVSNACGIVNSSNDFIGFLQISGTVVTYVLMAVQFRASWTQ